MVYCHECGAKCEEEAQYCIKCGNYLIKTISFEKKVEKYAEEFDRKAEQFGKYIEKKAKEFAKSVEESSRSKSMLCPNCKIEIYSDNCYCYKCGIKL